LLALRVAQRVAVKGSKTRENWMFHRASGEAVTTRTNTPDQLEHRKFKFYLVNAGTCSDSRISLKHITLRYNY
jgi:hypothetical protein